MKKIVFVLLLGVVSIGFTSCSSNDETADSGNTFTETDSTAVTNSSAIKEQDTTLQEVEVITLRALGNTLEEVSFDKDTLEVDAGSMVKLTLTNEAVDMPMLHNVVFTQPGKYKEVALAGSKVGASGNYIPLDSAGVLAASPIVLPGQTVELEFMAPSEPGTYDYVCTYPDHWQRMNGRFIVK